MHTMQFFLIDPTTVAPREYTVEGTTFAPVGLVRSADGKDASTEPRSEPFERLVEISAICNDSKIVYHAVCPSCPAVTTYT